MPDQDQPDKPDQANTPEQLSLSAPELPKPEDKTAGPDNRADVEALKRQLADARRQLDEAAPVLTAHREAEEARKSETQKLTEQLQAAQSEAERLRAERMRDRIARQAGVPDDLVELLNGGDEEALKAQATKIADALKRDETTGPRSGLTSRPKPVAGAGATKGGDEPGDIDTAALAAKIMRRRLG